MVDPITDDIRTTVLIAINRQKQTYAVHKAMSALPPKADMRSATRNVRFGPKADILGWEEPANTSKKEKRTFARASGDSFDFLGVRSRPKEKKPPTWVASTSTWPA